VDQLATRSRTVTLEMLSDSAPEEILNTKMNINFLSPFLLPRARCDDQVCPRKSKTRLSLSLFLSRVLPRTHSRPATPAALLPRLLLLLLLILLLLLFLRCRPPRASDCCHVQRHWFFERHRYSLQLQLLAPFLSRFRQESNSLNSEAVFMTSQMCVIRDRRVTTVWRKPLKGSTLKTFEFVPRQTKSLCECLAVSICMSAVCICVCFPRMHVFVPASVKVSWCVGFCKRITDCTRELEW